MKHKTSYTLVSSIHHLKWWYETIPKLIENLSYRSPVFVAGWSLDKWRLSSEQQPSYIEWHHSQTIYFGPIRSSLSTNCLLTWSTVGKIPFLYGRGKGKFSYFIIAKPASAGQWLTRGIVNAPTTKPDDMPVRAYQTKQNVCAKLVQGMLAIRL